MRAVVEFEFSASRFKLYVPKETCQIMFSLSSVKVPQKKEYLFKEASEFARSTVHQHDVRLIMYMNSSDDKLG